MRLLKTQKKPDRIRNPARFVGFHHLQSNPSRHHSSHNAETVGVGMDTVR